jgi:hypothetical protein
MRSKYGAIRTEVDGVTFASKAEASRYVFLKALEKAGEIVGLVLQPVFPLWAHTGVVADAPVTIGSYVADFAYDSHGTSVVEDVKGFKTPLYRWKKKHVEAQYGIQIREIR